MVAAFEPEPGMLIETPAEWEALGIDGLSLALDTGHCLVTQEIDPAEAVRRWAGRLGTVSIEDMQKGVHLHLPFGTGDMDIPAILDALEAIALRQARLCRAFAREPAGRQGDPGLDRVAACLPQRRGLSGRTCVSAFYRVGSFLP